LTKFVEISIMTIIDYCKINNSKNRIKENIQLKQIENSNRNSSIIIFYLRRKLTLIYN